MILVSGATGFVGRNLVDELLKGRQKVRCIVRDSGRAAALEDKGCEVVRGDVTERESVMKAARSGIDTAIHLVGRLIEARGASFEAVHVEATRNMVEACREMKIRRYLHVSALGAAPEARSKYHRTKWEAEEIVRHSGLQYTIFRPSVIFGANDKFTNPLARAIRLLPLLMLPGDGKIRMQPVFVRDVARLMNACVQREESFDKTYEVGGLESYTFDEIVDKIAEVFKKKVLKVHMPLALLVPPAFLAETVLSSPPLTRDMLSMLEEDNVTSEKAIEEVLGTKPTSFEEGLRSYLH